MDVERSLENIHLDPKQFLAMVQKAFPRCEKIEFYQLLFGGAQNTSYKFRIQNGEFVLRLYTRDRAHCNREKEIYSLIDGKVSTPKLIHAEVEDPFFSYSIFEFIDGILLYEVSQNCETLLSYDLGMLLGSIHAFTFQKAGLFGEGLSIDKPFEIGSSPYFEEAFSVLSKGKYAKVRLGDQLTNRMLEFMQKKQDFFPKVENNICLTHSDFKPVNLLIRSGKTFVLDWEFAHAGIGILDFAILLRHRDQFPLDLRLLEQGYIDCGGRLPKEWIRSALITDFVNIVSMLDAPSERPKLFLELKNAAQCTMDRWDFL